MHASSLKIAHYCLYVITTEAYTDACLRKFFFQTKISSVSIRVRSPCDLGYESWSQKTRFPVGENHMILRSLVLIQYERVTGRRTRRLFLCRAVAQLSATKNGHTKQNSKQTEAILYIYENFRGAYPIVCGVFQRLGTLSPTPEPSIQIKQRFCAKIHVLEIVLVLLYFE